MNPMVGHLWFVTTVAVDILHITIGRGGRLSALFVVIEQTFIQYKPPMLSSYFWTK